MSRPTGNSVEAAMRRLRKDRPDLYDLVLSGKMSPHGAMLEAGFRPKIIGVPLNIDRAANVLVRNFGSQVGELVDALLERSAR